MKRTWSTEQIAAVAAQLVIADAISTHEANTEHRAQGRCDRDACFCFYDIAADAGSLLDACADESDRRKDAAAKEAVK